MKYKIIIAFSLLIPLAGIIYAQQVSPYVSTTPPTGQYHPLSEIWINESTVNWKGLAFVNISKVGIGTLAPTQALDVIGNIQASGSLIGAYLKISSSVNSNLTPGSNLTYSLGTPSYWWKSLYVQTLCLNGACYSGWPISGSGQANYLVKWTGTNSVGTSIIYDTGTNIGIGTTSPQWKVDVRAVGDYVFHLGDNSGDDFTIDVAGGQGLVNLVAGAKPSGNSYVYIGTRGASRIELHDGTFYLYVGGTSGTAGSTVTWKTVMQGLSTGDAYFPNSVGIGTSSPSSTLEVAGDIKGNNIYPRANATYTLGSSTLMWANIYVTQICLNSACTARIYWNGTALIVEAPEVYFT